MESYAAALACLAWLARGVAVVGDAGTMMMIGEWG